MSKFWLHFPNRSTGTPSILGRVRVYQGNPSLPRVLVFIHFLRGARGENMVANPEANRTEIECSWHFLTPLNATPPEINSLEERPKCIDWFFYQNG